jgi:tRNA threonylcarbamoyladenosine modification (KEOPS) complex Cgi121 subunit
MTFITRRRLCSDLNHHGQDKKQRKDPCQLCACRATEADHHVVLFGSCDACKQETDDLCSYIAEKDNYHCLVFC